MFAVLRLLALVLLSPMLFSGYQGRATAAPLTAASYSTQRIDVTVRDAVYSPATGKLYASVPGDAPSYANRIVVVDPATGSIEKTINAGAEPNRLVLSDDGAYLYVGLDGEGGVRRVALSGQGGTLTFKLGDATEGTYTAESIAPMPGDPDTVAVRYKYQTPSLYRHSVALYRNGTKLPNEIATSLSITFCGSSDTLYGASARSYPDDGSFYRIAVGDTGLTIIDKAPYLGTNMGGFWCEGGLLYGGTGRVMDPQTRTLLGTYGPSSNPQAVDSAAGRVYQLDKSSDYWSFDKGTLSVYKQDTYQRLEQHEISGLPEGESAARLVVAGSDHFAVVSHAHAGTQGGLRLIHRTGASTGSTGNQLTGGTVSTDTGQFEVQEIGLPVRDAVYSKLTGNVYGSVTASAGLRGNSIARIDPATGTVEATIYVGSNPDGLALSSDGRYLWVGLSGAAAIRLVDLLQWTTGPVHPLGRNEHGWYFPTDLAVAPGNPSRVAVSLRNNVIATPDYEGVAVYDDGRMLPAKTRGHSGPNRIEFCSGADALYGYDNDSRPYAFYRMIVSDKGVTIRDSANNMFVSFDVDITCDAGLLYATYGAVMDPRRRQKLGVYHTPAAYGGGVAVDPARSVVYSLGGDDGVTQGSGTGTLNVHNAATFQRTETHKFTGMRGGVRNLILAGSGRMALVTLGHGGYEGDLYLIRRIRNDAAPQPDPSWSNVSAKTMPGRLAARKLSIPIRDVAYSPLTKKLYVSTSGKEGTRGNSILAIDPLTGALSGQVYVGSEPEKLSVTRDGRYLWVGLDGMASVRRVDLVGLKADPPITLGFDWAGWFYAGDLAAAPGRTDTFAVAWRNYADGHRGVGMYRNGVRLMNWVNPGMVPSFFYSNRIEFCDRPDELYGADDEWSSFEFNRMRVDDSGVSYKDTLPHAFEWGNFDIVCQGGLVVGTHGEVMDPATMKRVATYPAVAGGIAHNALVADPSARRMYVASDHDYNESTDFLFSVYDSSGYFLVDSYQVSGVPGLPQRLVRVDNDHLALRSSNNLYLLQRTATGTMPTVSLGMPTAGSAVRSRVTLSAKATDDAGVARVEFLVAGTLVGTDTAPDASGNYTATWDTTMSTDGVVLITARAIDTAGNASPTSRTVTVDNVRPVAVAPVHVLSPNTTVGANTVPVRLTWSATDATSGVARYQLQQRRHAGGSWGAWEWVTQGTTSRTLIRQLAPGTYQFQLRAQDQAGNWSAWKAGTAFVLSSYDETSPSISYTGTWARVALSGAYGGNVKHASASTARAKLTFTGRQVQWVSTRSADRGKAEVWVDGAKVATVDLYSSSVKLRQTVFTKVWSTSGTHTLEVRVLGMKNVASTGTRVDVDAFLALR